MIRVILESPYAGDIKKNKAYARKAMKHSLQQGEAPIASHLLYTQVLRDDQPGERKLGIDAGLAWAEVADKAVFYADLGFSMGMLHALKVHAAASIPVEIRYLYAPRRKPKGQGPTPDNQATRPLPAPAEGFIDAAFNPAHRLENFLQP
jgi:hypothetical protein